MLRSGQFKEERVMWNSSRRVALIAAALILMLAIATGYVWLSHTYSIEFGGTEAGRLAEADAQTEPGLLSPEQLAQTEPIGSLSDTSVGGDVVFGGQGEPTTDDSAPIEFTPTRSEIEQTSGIAEQRPEILYPEQSSPQTTALPSRIPDFPASDSPPVKSNRSGRSSGQSSGTTVRAAFNSQPVETESSTSANPFASESASAPKTTPLFDVESQPTLAQSRRFPMPVMLAQNEPQPLPESPAPTTTSPFDTPTSEPKVAEANSEFAPPVSTPAFNPPEPIKTKTVSRRTEPAVGETKIDLAKIDKLLEGGDLVAAHRELSAIYWNQPDQRPAIMSRLERNAQTIYLSPKPHFAEPHVVQSGELLQGIARKYQMSWQYLAALNNVDPKRVRVGQKLKIIKGPFSAFVDLSDFELTVHAHGYFVKRYQIGIGRDGGSPTGKFKVLEKVEKPQYTDPKGKVIAGGHPTNPLGTHWLDIGESYGIHGTIEPQSIGKAESAGCIRMRNEDIGEVYNFLVKGSEVVIRE